VPVQLQRATPDGLQHGDLQRERVAVAVHGPQPKPRPR
jgi:hypothetical protein